MPNCDIPSLPKLTTFKGQNTEELVHDFLSKDWYKNCGCSSSIHASPFQRRRLTSMSLPKKILLEFIIHSIYFILNYFISYFQLLQLMLISQSTESYAGQQDALFLLGNQR